ncbi:MAG: 5-oxoprolinase subunit PxpB [Burkholderiales bacterium]
MARPRIPVVKPQAIIPLGDAAVLIDFADSVDTTVNAGIQRLARILHRKRVAWIRDVVPGLASLALHFDPATLGDRDPVEASETLIDECLARALNLIDEPAREVEVPICYDEAFGLDLRELSEVLRVPIDEIARRHAGSEFAVLMMGFAPGHPYLGGLDSALTVPRRATPRALVPGGSVGIANRQSVVYPYALPGGWNIVGRTPLRLFDAAQEEPSLFEPGDAVRFRPIDRVEFDRIAKSEGMS